jgi:hypothetical protein
MNLDKERQLNCRSRERQRVLFCTFIRAMGATHRCHISRMRPENAMAEMAAGKPCLAEIALKLALRCERVLRGILSDDGLTPGESERAGASAETDCSRSVRVTAQTIWSAEGKSAQNDSKPGKEQASEKWFHSS